MTLTRYVIVVLALGSAPAFAEDPPAFDGSRAALEIPDAVWEQVLKDAGRPGGKIGYSADEMRAFGKDTHLLRTVEGLFRDVRKIPRETGRITDQLLENVKKPSEVIARGYALTDVFAGRILGSGSFTQLAEALPQFGLQVALAGLGGGAFIEGDEPANGA